MSTYGANTCAGQRLALRGASGGGATEALLKTIGVPLSFPRTGNLGGAPSAVNSMVAFSHGDKSPSSQLAAEARSTMRLPFSFPFSFADATRPFQIFLIGCPSSNSSRQS